MENISPELFRLYFEESNDAILLIDGSNWKLLAANRFAKKLFGVGDEDYNETTFPQFRRIIKLAKRDNTESVFTELTLDTKDFGEIRVDIFAKIIDWDGKALIIATCRNVADNYFMSEKLVQTDKLVLLGQISASLVHEIRNPLAAINLNLQLLNRAAGDNKEMQSYINSALQGVERISKLIDVTLGFSRQTTPQIEKVNINSIIVATVDLMNHLMKKKEITITFNLKNDLPPISADSKHIQQILINLISNSIDAIEGNGRIALATFLEEAPEFKEKFVCVSIEDNGVGISEEDLDKIFNPFFTKKPNGTGLGMAITQKLLYKYNGSILVSSKVGEGTRIVLKFPSSE
ncbi:MAG: two-component system sensor histidine kinase NtrB [Candidatus Kapaibacteriota bacterium]|jgi:signal transduction histidine kinase